MRYFELVNENGGRVVKDVNTTVDVDIDEITKQAKKFGNHVTKDGYPPLIRETQELDEIVHSGYEEEDGAVQGFLVPYQKELFSKGKQIGELLGYDLWFANLLSGSEFLYGLTSENKLIAIIMLNMTSDLFPSIGITWVDPTMRGKGIMKALVTYLFKEYDYILSDSQQSSQAKQMWQSLIKNPPVGSKVVIWNNQEAKSAEIGSSKYPWAKDPWNNSYDTQLMLVRA